MNYKQYIQKLLEELDKNNIPIQETKTTNLCTIITVKHQNQTITIAVYPGKHQEKPIIKTTKNTKDCLNTLYSPQGLFQTPATNPQTTIKKLTNTAKLK